MRSNVELMQVAQDFLEVLNPDDINDIFQNIDTGQYQIK